MPLHSSQYGGTCVPGTHSLPPQRKSPKGQLSSQGGSYVPPHPYSPGRDMSCCSPQIPGGGFGPRYLMNHTAPGRGIQHKTASEMAAQLSCHGVLNQGQVRGQFGCLYLVPVPQWPEGLRSQIHLWSGFHYDWWDLGVQTSEAQVIQNPRSQVTQTPDSLGHLGKTGVDPSAAVSEHVTLQDADASGTLATTVANATGSGYNAFPGTSWSDHVSVNGVGGAPGPSVPTTNPGQGKPSAGDGSHSTRQKHKPDKYDGTSDWANYLRHFEMVSTWNRWGAEDKAAQLSMYLTGVARQAWC